MHTELAADEWQVKLAEKLKNLTLLVVIDDGGDAIATDHSFFTTSYTKVSPCPEKCKGKLEI